MLRKSRRSGRLGRLVMAGAAGLLAVSAVAAVSPLGVSSVSAEPDGTSTYVPQTPRRLFDTRENGNGEAVTGGARLGSGAVLEVQVRGPHTTKAGVNWSVPDTAVAVAMNVTSVAPTAVSFVTVYPTGGTVPNASTLNMRPGMKAVPNMIIVPLGADGKVTLFNSLGTTDLLIDVLGWFPSTSSPSTTERVNIDSAETEAVGGNSSRSSISDDGRFVAFESAANNLVGGDTNGILDVFVRDQLLGTTVRVSVTSDGAQGDDASFDPEISGNGRYVTFTSAATNLVAGDTNAVNDVFIHDLQTHTTLLVSAAGGGASANGASEHPSINADGSVVAFASLASNIGFDGNGAADIFVRDFEAGTTTRVSKRSLLVASNGHSVQPSVSDDGTVVAFESQATNLDVNVVDNNLVTDIYVAEGGVVRRVSESTSGVEANDGSYAPDISGDGTVIAFQSWATNLIDGPAEQNNVADIFYRSLTDDVTRRVTRPIFGFLATNGDSITPSVSDDGRYVAFASNASNLIPGDLNSLYDVFVFDSVDNQITRISGDEVESDGNSLSPSISANGRFITYRSGGTDLVYGDNNGLDDIFLHDQGTKPIVILWA